MEKGRGLRGVGWGGGFQNGGELAEGQASITGGDLTGPMHFEPGGSEGGEGGFGETTVLEATAAESDAGFALGAGHGDDAVGQAGMESGGQQGDRGTVFAVAEQGVDQGFPIEVGTGCGEAGGLGGRIDQGQGVAGGGTFGVGNELEGHGGVAFEATDLAEAEEGGDGIEEATDTGSPGSVEAAVQGGGQDGQVVRIPGLEGWQVGLGPRGVAPQGVEEAEGGASGFAHGGFAAGEAEGTQAGATFGMAAGDP
jgi:hypothetical protein